MNALAQWILIFNINVAEVPSAAYLNSPVVMDSFPSQERCETALQQLSRTFEGTSSKGYCVGESR
jgi:hypothetical protein